MSSGPSRATFSSLRARREAHQVASDILYAERIDLGTFRCPVCHTAFNRHASEAWQVVLCSDCGKRIFATSDPQAVLPHNLTPREIDALAEDARLNEWAEAEARREVRRIIWGWSIGGAASVIALGALVYYCVYG